MPDLVLIPFAIFALCCIAQLAVLKQIRDRMIDQHPDEYLAEERGSFFPQQSMFRFAWRNHHKALNDPELSRSVRNLRILYGVAFLAWLAIFALTMLAPGRA